MLFVFFIYCFTGIVNSKVRFKVLKLLFGRADKHIFNKVCLPCYFCNKADRTAACFACPCKDIHNINIFTRKLFFSQIKKLFIDLFFDRSVHVTPCDVFI